MTPKPHRAPGAMPRALAAWTVNISASPTYLWPRQYSTITATTNQELGPTPYYLIIGQLVGGTSAWAPVAICGSGTSCGVSVTRESPGINSYQAYVGTYSTTVPPPDVQATGEDVGPSRFWIQVYDLTSGTRLAVCGYGTSCTARVSPWQAVTRSYGATVSDNTAAWPPTGTISWSAATYVTWSNSGYQLSLTAPSSASGGTAGYVTVTATANVDVGPTPYFIEIFNQGTGALAGRCGSGSVCSVQARVVPGWNSHVAVISPYDDHFLPATVLANSNSAHTNFSRLT